MLVDGVVVAVFSVLLLEVKRFFDGDGIEMGVVLDKIFPEEFFFIRSLLDFSQRNISRCHNLVICGLKGGTDALVSFLIFGFGRLKLFDLFFEIGHVVIHAGLVDLVAVVAVLFDHLDLGLDGGCGLVDGGEHGRFLFLCLNFFSFIYSNFYLCIVGYFELHNS